MEKDYIKQTLSTQGWEYIDKMLRDKIVDLSLARNVKDKRYEDIAIETLARAKAANKVLSVLKSLERIKNSQTLKKESFK